MIMNTEFEVKLFGRWKSDGEIQMEIYEIDYELRLYERKKKKHDEDAIYWLHRDRLRLTDELGKRERRKMEETK